MNKKFNKLLIFLLLIPALILILNAGEKKKSKKPYIFKHKKIVKHTSVKNQFHSGTCWSFATISFLEAEILREKGEKTDLSEMYIVKHAYTDKALNYIQMHGLANFNEGGQAHDLFNQAEKHGLVPESVYKGYIGEEKKHIHGELISVLKGFLQGLTTGRFTRLSTVWKDAFKGILDTYLGKDVKTFTYKGEEVTPLSYMKDKLGINISDYVEITSYIHHPFYKKIRLEIPDNWTYNSDYLNVPLDELVEIADNAIKSGYTFVWDCDVSSKFFSKGKNDISVVPEKLWEDMSRKEKNQKIKKPLKELEVDQKYRQKAFENWSATDDHLVHIVGMTHDQNGNKFYIMKNSWGTDRENRGYFYVSEPFFRLYTINIAINKKAIPEKIREKLNL